MNVKYKELQNLIKNISSRAQIPNLISFLKNPKICEVGVQNGHHFFDLLTDNVEYAYAVDCWSASGKFSENDSFLTQSQLDEQYDFVCNRFKSDNRVKIIRDFSINASKNFEDESLDFVYIDADHTYKNVKIDLECWYPKLKKYGILSGHDYIKITHFVDGKPLKFEVIEAVSDFMKKNNINDIHVTQEEYASFFIIKT